MPDDRKPFHNPFAALGRLRDVPGTPATPAPAPPAPASAPTSAPTSRPVDRTIPRAVVRIERSGRGGREVTVVEHLGLPAADLARWLGAMKSGLGCGGVVEGDAIVLQGDQRKRLSALLTARGVKRVINGTE